MATTTGTYKKWLASTTFWPASSWRPTEYGNGSGGIPAVGGVLWRWGGFLGSHWTIYAWPCSIYIIYNSQLDWLLILFFCHDLAILATKHTPNRTSNIFRALPIWLLCKQMAKNKKKKKENKRKPNFTLGPMTKCKKRIQYSAAIHRIAWGDSFITTHLQWLIWNHCYFFILRVVTTQLKINDLLKMKT